MLFVDRLLQMEYGEKMCKTCDQKLQPTNTEVRCETWLNRSGGRRKKKTRKKRGGKEGVKKKYGKFPIQCSQEFKDFFKSLTSRRLKNKIIISIQERRRRTPPMSERAIAHFLNNIPKKLKEFREQRNRQGGRKSRKKKTRRKRGGLGITLEPNTTNEYLYTNPHNGQQFQVSVTGILGDEEFPLHDWLFQLPLVLIANNERRLATEGDAFVVMRGHRDPEFAVPISTLTPIEQGGGRHC